MQFPVGSRGPSPRLITLTWPPASWATVILTWAGVGDDGGLPLARVVPDADFGGGGGQVGLDARAVEAVGFELRFSVVDIVDLIRVGGVEGFGEGGEEAAVLALADEDLAIDFAKVAGGGYGVAGEEVLF